LTDAFAPVSTDRLLILAPHPDDESIATGGLVQHARDAGAAVRVVVLTDGDNNLWPQRWIEKRWRIDASARARWGARRREEARAAMGVLGMADADARFLGLPDLGLTDLLMRADRAIIAVLRDAIAEFAPTLLALPALSDRHPDHSSAYILAQLALAQAKRSPRQFAFAVHGGNAQDAAVRITLVPAQRELKRQAILAHDTQMRLSGRRFLRYADEHEYFQIAPGGASPEHPVSASVADGQLRCRVDVQRARGTLRGHVLFFALHDGRRFLVPIAARTGSVETYDTIAGQTGHAVNLQRGANEILVTLPCNAGGYVKLARPQPGWRVFDRFGWQVITVS
jgi:LmbE family N-acetylglucosaminyl deacetylase